MKKEEYNHYYGLGNIFNPFNTGVVNPSTLITISGTIVDEDNQPVPNANVIIEGTAIGTMADFDGRFTLNNVPSNATIELSYQGVITRYPASRVKGIITINIGNMLDEAVVTAPSPVAKSTFWRNATYLGLGGLLLFALTRKDDKQAAPKPAMAGPRKRKTTKRKKTHIKVKL